MSARGLTAVLTIVASVGLATPADPAGAQSTTTTTTTTTPTTTTTTTTPTNDPLATTTSVPQCPDPAAIEYVAVFTGVPDVTDDDQLLVVDVTVEQGTVVEPVLVAYPDGLPILEDGERVRIRVTESEDGYRSEVQCGATTTTDDERLEVDDDRLAAIARTAGDLSVRAGRWALIGSGVLFALVIVTTALRRWRPRLW